METLNNQFDISVIVPTYNRSVMLGYTLQSLAAQDIDKNRFEVIVADDGSFDDTPEVIKMFADSLHIKYTFQEDKGYRPASARNMGIRAANGNICLFIDSGVIANTDCLARHIAFHAQGPDLAAIGYIYWISDGEEVYNRLKRFFDPANPTALFEQIAGLEACFDVREYDYRSHNDRIERLPAPWYFFWAGHISVSRANLFKVGLFDENFDDNWGIEDNDLGYRLWEAGISIRLLRSARCAHIHHHTDTSDKLDQGRKNCQYFHSKYQTPETALFLKYFSLTHFVDINALVLEQRMQGAGTSK